MVPLSTPKRYASLELDISHGRYLIRLDQLCPPVSFRLSMQSSPISCLSDKICMYDWYTVFPSRLSYTGASRSIPPHLCVNTPSSFDYIYALRSHETKLAGAGAGVHSTRERSGNIYLTGEAATQQQAGLRGTPRRPMRTISQSVSQSKEADIVGVGGCGGQWEGDQSEKSYTEDGDAAHDGGVLGRGQGVVGGSEDALGGALAVAGGLDVDLFGRHHLG